MYVTPVAALPKDRCEQALGAVANGDSSFFSSAC